MKSPILSPAFPQLPTGDVEVTAVFFKKLGFEAVFRQPQFLIVRRGVTEIHFWQAPTEEEARSVGGESSCYIRVEGIETLFEEFRSAGVRFRYELTRQPWGMNEFQIDDPYRNAIKFGAPV